MPTNHALHRGHIGFILLCPHLHGTFTLAIQASANTCGGRLRHGAEAEQAKEKADACHIFDNKPMYEEMNKEELHNALREKDEEINRLTAELDKIPNVCALCENALLEAREELRSVVSASAPKP